MENAFWGASNLVNKAADIPVFATNATPNFRNMFANSGIGGSADTGNWAWNTAAVTDMSNMFLNTSFNKNISGWNTSAVTNMNSMFLSADAFNRNLGSWNMEKVANAEYMLNNSGLNESNYNATLQGWAAQDLIDDITLGATGLTYSVAGKVGRDKITASVADGGDNWTITGDSFLPFNLDIDGDGAISTAIDGVLIMRYLLNKSADMIDISGIIFADNASRTTTVAILSHLNAGKLVLDIDDDSKIEAATDGVLILNFMLATDSTLNITDAVGDNAIRNTATTIKAYLDTINL